jgi:hypothetical protein
MMVLSDPFCFPHKSIPFPPFLCSVGRSVLSCPENTGVCPPASDLPRQKTAPDRSHHKSQPEDPQIPKPWHHLCWRSPCYAFYRILITRLHGLPPLMQKLDVGTIIRVRIRSYRYRIMCRRHQPLLLLHWWTAVVRNRSNI